MRTAVLADVHGNAPALRAVLASLDAEPVDAIVVAGDVVGGPQPREVLEALAARREPVHWIRGNAERETLAVADGAPVTDDEAGRAGEWSAGAIGAEWLEAIASWPIARTVGGTLFCHGSPRRDDEIVTRATPRETLAEILGGVDAPLVIGGHTHQQFVCALGAGRPTYANAGSVGMPYEGRPGAFWAVVQDGEPDLRETGYDLERAAVELRATGAPDVDGMLQESLLAPIDPGWVTAFFEHAAGRGPAPGDPPLR